MSGSPWSRLKRAKIVQVLVVYLGASWAIIEIADVLQDTLALPEWVSPLAFLLLLIGLVIVLATAFVQSNPLTSEREKAGEVPGTWQLGLKEAGSSIAKGKLPHLTWGRTILGGLVAFWFLFGLAGLYLVVTGRTPSLGPEEVVADEAPSGIAVVPFTVRGTDLEVWREGMMDLFTTSLDGVGGYRTIDTRTVLSRWSQALDVEDVPDLDLTLEVAEATGARYALVGSAVSVAGNVRLAAEIYDLESGAEVGRGRVEGSPDSVLSLVDALSIDIMRELLAETGQHIVSESRLASVTTSSLPALQAYLEGEAAFRRSDFTTAVGAYERAVTEDSTFALALWRLSTAHSWTRGYDYWGFDRDRLEQAGRNAERMPPRDKMLLDAVLAFERGDRDDLRLARGAVRRYPDDPDAWAMLGEVFVHSRTAVFEDVEEGVEAIDKAIALDPTFTPYYIHRIELAIARDDTAGAYDLLERYVQLAGPRARDYLAIAVPLFLGDSAQRAAALAVADTIDPEVLEDLYGNLDWSIAALDAQEALLDAMIRAQTAAMGPVFSSLMGERLQTLIAQGKYAEAYDILQDPRLPASERAEEGFVLSALVRSVPAEQLDTWLDPANCESVMCEAAVGAYAADRGRWDVHEAILDQGREIAGEFASQGRAIRASSVEVGIAALEGYGLLQRGRIDEAIETLEAVQGRKYGSDHWVRWWLAEAYVAAGRPEDAIPYYRSLWLNRFKFYGAYRLGELYTELGRPDEARKAYASFLRMWKDADPDLPQLEHAREALRLESRSQ